jgi:hypothetical protein
MAVQGLNNLQVSYAKDWAGLTTDNHLFAIYQNEPQLASDIITQIHGMMNFSGLDTFLSKFPTQYYDTDADYRWMLRGDDEKAINIVSFSSPDLTRPGVGRGRFQLTVGERYFYQSDVLIFDDRTFNVRVMNDGEASGTNWTYDVEHMRPSDTHFIPPALMVAGRKVSKQNNIVTNTLNKEYTQTQFNSHFEMRNIFSTLSKEQIVAGNMHNRPLLIKMKAPDGQEAITWTRYQDLVCEWQWRKEKSRQLMYSEYNQDSNGTYSMRGSSGFVIKQGAGLREQISPSYKFTYNTLTLDYLLDVGYNLSLNILPEDQREFLILTGERGMILFSKLIEDKVAIFQPLDSKRVLGSGQNLGFGGQYRTYLGPQGIKFTVMHMPEYDNTVHNRLPHPDGGNAESYRMTIMNIGTTNGAPNIQKVAVRGREDIKWYVAGSTSPFGPQKGGMGASKVDGYSIYYQTTQGIMLRNPLSAAELIPNIVY